MKAKLLTSSLAAVLLSACSGSAGPFDGKTPEELAMLILGGLEKDENITFPDGGFIKVNTIKDKPLTLELAGTVQGQSRSVATFTITDQGNCTFLYEVADRTPDQSIGTLQVRANFSGLTSAKAGPGRDALTLSGSQIQCIANQTRPCEYMQPDLDKGAWWRGGMINDVSGKKEREAMETRLNDAIQHLKTNICKT